VPSPGRYRLFLDFSHGGVVRTAEFTVTSAPGAGGPAESASPAATTAPSTKASKPEAGTPAPSEAESKDHDDDHG